LYDSTEPESRALYDAVRGVAEKTCDSVATIDAAPGLAPPCINCFHCWIKTPGECVLPRDRATEFPDRFWDADFVVIVSRILWGGYSTRVKLYLDRLLPILHPYFEKRNGEMHHKLRYGRQAVFLAVGYGARTTGEEETFSVLAASNRDQGPAGRNYGHFLVGLGENPRDKAASCAEWLSKEISK
jgi:multimeric flavodoxin WrbA